LFEVFVEDSAKKEIKKIPKDLIKAIEDGIEDLEKNPKPHGSKKIKGYANLWRIRFGKYRVVYELHEIEKRVIIFRIRHRKDVYENL